MKKMLVLAAALLAAAPAAAQQSADASDAPAVSVSAPAAPSAAAPSIYVSRDEIRQKVVAAESERGKAPVGSNDWWYTVAAVAVGVIIALLLID
jgi:hypothetical protein